MPRNEQPLPPTPRSHSTSGNSDLISATSQIYLPEFIYLGVTAPTRNHTELHIFKQHCLYLLQGRTEKHISHPLTELQTITPHIGAFNKFFWKYHTSITVNSILEDYRGILHQSDTRCRERSSCQPETHSQTTQGPIRQLQGISLLPLILTPTK